MTNEMPFVLAVLAIIFLMWMKQEMERAMADVKDYPPYMDYPKERKKQTNADKYFRNATDRQIADFIHEVGRDMACPPCICPEYKDCYKCWLDWLKQEVQDAAD